MFKSLPQQRQGELFVIFLTFIEGWFPILATPISMQLGGIHAYFYSIVIATALLGLLLFSQGKLNQLKQANSSLFAASFFITSVYLLCFCALQYTSASHVALILFCQILFSQLYFGNKDGETLLPVQVVGMLVMTLGTLVILFPGTFLPNLGDGMVVIAAMLAPMGNYYQKKARKQVASVVIIAARGLFALPFVYLLMVVIEDEVSWNQLETVAIQLLIVGSLVFVVAKIAWVEALHRLPISKVIALYAFSPLLTLIIASYWLSEAPTWSQIVGAICILVGSYWITRTPPNLIAEK